MMGKKGKLNPPPLFFLHSLTSTALFVSTTAAPPMRNRVLGMSMDRSSPRYQFWVMFSVETTSAYEERCVARHLAASWVASTPAEQPIPAKLNDTMSDRILKWLTSMADREGVGLNSEQLTTKMSMSVGFSCNRDSTSDTVVNSTMRASSRASAMVRAVGVAPGKRRARSAGSAWRAGGR